MAWTTPKTWSSEPLTSGDLNTYLRDNPAHLYDRLENNAGYELNTTNYSTTSTSFVDVDATNLSFTITTHGGDVLVGFAGAMGADTGGRVPILNIAVDSVDYFTEGVTIYRHGTHTNEGITFVARITGLSAGSHNFKLRWKTNAGTATLYGYYGQMWVQEI